MSSNWKISSFVRPCCRLSDTVASVLKILTVDRDLLSTGASSFVFLGKDTASSEH